MEWRRPAVPGSGSGKGGLSAQARWPSPRAGRTRAEGPRAAPSVDFARVSTNLGGRRDEVAMFDPYTRKGRILAAALRCAAQKSWADVTLLDVAESANLPILELRDEFTSKTQLLAGLLRAIDEEVLKRAAKR